MLRVMCIRERKWLRMHQGVMQTKSWRYKCIWFENIQKYILNSSIQAVNGRIAAKAADQILPSVYILVCRPHAFLSRVHPQFMSSVGWVMNFGREVARQTSCYTYVIEDEEPALASLNVFEVRLSSDKCILCTEKMYFTQHKIKRKKSESAGLQKGDFKMLSLFKVFFCSVWRTVYGMSHH